MNKNLLWISFCAPYDKVQHAGGKIHNYYLKYFQKSGGFNIRLISFCYSSEKELLDLDDYRIKNKIFVLEDNWYQKLLKQITNANQRLNPFHSYAGLTPDYQRIMTMNEVRKYSSERYEPDIIILQWTQMVLLAPLLKKIFPKAKLVAIEEDVAFLGYRRRVEYASNRFTKLMADIRYKKLKKIELDVLDKMDLVVFNNPKDELLVKKNECKVKRSIVVTPYFTNYSRVKRKFNRNRIIFFGAMSREENHLSAIWFLKHVFYKLDESIEFVIIGGNPKKEILDYQSDRVKVLGFVDNIEPYFSDCLCMVAPLVLGAGIKIKILEAFSAGVPVLTNQIGIEGIRATNGEDYVFCESPEDYINAISQLRTGMIEHEKLSDNAKKLIDEKYNFSKTTQKFLEMVKSI